MSETTTPPAEHSKFSASAAHRWMACPGSIPLSEGLPNTSSRYADEGTAAHELFDRCIKSGAPAKSFLGQVMYLDWEATDDMVNAVQTALDNVAEMTAGRDVLLSEQTVNYSAYLNVPRDAAWGRLDLSAIVSSRSELQVHDYKHGQGEEVLAHEVLRVNEDGTEVLGPNPQLALYALGQLTAYADLFEILDILLVVHQPRKASAPSTYRMTAAELLKWGRDRARPAAMSVLNAEALKAVAIDRTWQETFLKPGPKQCRWCPAKATCPALREAAVETIFGGNVSADDFIDASIPKAAFIEPASDEWLAATMAKADMIEDWITAVRAEVERRLLGGGAVRGYKLVQGRQGNRAWANAEEAEAQLKAMRLKVEQMYDLSLISPTSAEKLAIAPDPAIGPRQWKKLQAIITRSPGKLHVAPVSDKRPAVSVAPVSDSFDAAPNPEDFV